MEKKLQNICLKYYNLLLTHDLWQAHYQILSTVLLKEFIKLNANTDTMIKKLETCKIEYKHCDYFLEYTTFKDDKII